MNREIRRSVFRDIFPHSFMETLQKKIFSMFAFSPFSFRIEPVILSQKNSEGAKKNESIG
ncbi:hypothetical protein EY650_09850 [Enterococcus faecalis]|nr:hypothetical protein [Enterococcus faecalis]MBO6430185.1 hypothetical protein [Enterococcus faecalis]MBO6443204.1 hypothetical protein [Enterococcus faecalis]MBO6445601.1 hypothetical protein [Enterococcus faecalis]MBO6458231.1 hypothetical protein [Enterococcus faecalis]